MLTIYEYYNPTGTEVKKIYGSIFYGQSFTIGNTGTNITHILTSIDVKVSRTGNPGTVTVNVQAVDGSGKPTGLILSTGTFDGNGLTTSLAETAVTMSSVILYKNTQYCFWLKAPSGTLTNCININDDAVAPPPPCFLKNTKINVADGTHKFIEEIKIGEHVLGYNETTMEIVLATVTKTFIHLETKGYYMVELEGEDILYVTGNHPVYTNNGYCKVQDLVTGNMIGCLSEGVLIYKLVTNISIITNEVVDTFNLEVEDTHNYFAEECLVHNK